MSKSLLLKDIKKSCLTQAHANKLKLQYIHPSKLGDLTGDQFKDVPAYKIPYFTIDGKKKNFYRIRFLGNPKAKGFGAKHKKAIRYWQPPKTPPTLYLPPVIGWRSIAKDVTKDIYITEGEKKAACACVHDLPCIGLGGVWSWRSKNLEQPVIPELLEFQWERRNVHLCFDSDAHTNPKVIHALNEFSKMMLSLGAIVHTISLYGEEPDEKLGIDDYIDQYGIEQFNELAREPFNRSEELWRLNEEVAFIRSISAVYNIVSRTTCKSRQHLVELEYANRNYTIYDHKTEKWVTHNAMKEWLKWEYRREHAKIAYMPGGDVVLPDGSLNIWQGWGCEPEEGSVKPWLDMVKLMFKGNKDHMEWFIRWLAYPLQNPGVKMITSVLLWSSAQGTGKSFLGYIMGDIYGENFSKINEEQLHSPYNDWLVGKQFILGEEITGTDKRRDNNRIKDLITQEKATVSIKYQPSYPLDDFSVYLFTSNFPDAQFVEGTDRRAFIHEVSDKESPEFYRKVDKWRKKGGSKHLFHWLLEYDLGDFDPLAEPPMTASKEDMIGLSKSDLDLFVEKLLLCPSEILRVGGVEADRDIYTLDELMTFLHSDIDRQGISRVALGKALRRGGLIQRVVRTQDGARRLWAVRNVAKWRKASGTSWSENNAPGGVLVAQGGAKVVALASAKRAKYKGKACK